MLTQDYQNDTFAILWYFEVSFPLLPTKTLVIISNPLVKGILYTPETNGDILLLHAISSKNK